MEETKKALLLSTPEPPKPTSAKREPRYALRERNSPVGFYKEERYCLPNVSSLSVKRKHNDIMTKGLSTPEAQSLPSQPAAKRRCTTTNSPYERRSPPQTDVLDKSPPKPTTVKFICKPCTKHFKTKGFLQRHYWRSPSCLVSMNQTDSVTSSPSPSPTVTSTTPDDDILEQSFGGLVLTEDDLNSVLMKDTCDEHLVTTSEFEKDFQAIVEDLRQQGSIGPEIDTATPEGESLDDLFQMAQEIIDADLLSTFEIHRQEELIPEINNEVSPSTMNLNSQDSVSAYSLTELVPATKSVWDHLFDLYVKCGPECTSAQCQGYGTLNEVGHDVVADPEADTKHDLDTLIQSIEMGSGFDSFASMVEEDSTLDLSVFLKRYEL